jgi:HK97 family phage portal protein
VPLFNVKKRNNSSVGVLLPTTNGIAIPSGYHYLTDAPEVAAAVWRISDMVSSVTIRQMKNTDKGDVRVKDALSRKVDIAPWSLGTRQTFIGWIVSTMLLEGEAFVLPSTFGGLLLDLTPMPTARAQLRPDGTPYEIVWNGVAFDQDEVLHFRLRPDPRHPWKGIGPRIQLQTVVDSIVQTSATKLAYMSSEYKPPLIVSVDSDSDLSDEDKRSSFISHYLRRKTSDEPLIIPANLMKVEQVKPLSLTDLAIKDGVEIDKKTVASLLGVPGYMVGVGSYSSNEYNNFVRSVLIPLCKILEQELTKKLLYSDDRYFKFNTLRLYDYDMQTLSNIGRNMHSDGLMTGNEVRDWLELSPLDGLDELVILENYIPADRTGDQKKLNDKEDDNNADSDT